MNPGAPHGLRGTIGAGLAIVALVFAVHGIDVTHAFTGWDDTLLVTGNELLNPVTPEKVGRMWSAPVEGLYTPLAYTLWAGVTLFARTTATADGVTLSPAAFHVLNLLLHAGCSVLVLAILLRLTGAPVASLIGAAVFVVHPLQVEPVAWVSGMNNLLAGMFSLASVLSYLKALPPLPGGEEASLAVGVRGEMSQADRRTKASDRPTPLPPPPPAGACTPPRWGEGGRRWYIVALLLFLLACFSKPTAIVTPLILLVIDALLLRRSLRSIAVALLPFLVIAMPFIAVGRSVQSSGDVDRPAVHHRLLIAADAVGFYLQKLAVPWPLYIDYGRTPQKVIAAGPSLWPTVALMAAVIALIVCRRQRWVVAGVAVFVGAMCLVIGLVPFDFQAYSTVADRYAYLSMLGIAMLVAFGLARSGRAACGLAALLVLAVAGLSFAQSLYWRDDHTLAAHQLRHNPDSLAAHALLGDIAKRNGDNAAFEQQVRAMLAIRPQDGRANLAMAELHFNAGRYADALPHYQAVYDAGQRSAAVLNNMGLSLWKTEQLERAADLFGEAVARNPNLFNAQLNRGLILARLGRLDQSAFHLQQATQLDPTSQLARDSLSRVNTMRGVRN